ncbi:response regulator [Solitalea canadensis]|uniref:Response regulator containing a CheY-like receiver domain and an HTH DNA-binding domain n=1 Tax=Solitalea canadensis (strain ATCC 29591 / DSM 3403 / JCM 21819 / LMG 8368 / NBRC 15130 / NCIMB 12057 / USAM 9D) TaxID=929556 RepID=H8KTN3_SOLCM|nr:response regulator [Solitalea canadensis]AFD06608.1 response regulator containing a CheY-like receiver domain and an HTH DNA-binding domain [Solitalea canadensis DSM 3403]
MQPISSCFLIDDDLDDQEIFKLAISDIEYPIVCMFARDGAEALQKLESLTKLPSIVFLDINMPRMNGKIFLKLFKDDPRFMHIPVIIYSTYFNKRIEQEMIELGADGYIEKPPSVKDLTQKLQKIFIRMLPIHY